MRVLVLPAQQDIQAQHAIYVLQAIIELQEGYALNVLLMSIVNVPNALVIQLAQSVQLDILATYVIAVPLVIIWM